MLDVEKMHLKIKNPQILVRNCKFRTVDYNCLQLMKNCLMAIVLLITMSCIETCEESVKRIYLEQNFCGIVDTLILNPREQKEP